jgi:hypothetical protein
VDPGPRVRDWAVGFSGGEEAHYRRRWRAPHTAVAFSTHGGQRPKSMTRGPGPPCQRLVRCFRRS